MDKEELLLQKRLEDLAARAYMKNLPQFSDFLNMREQSIALQMQKQESFAGLTVTFEGGYPDAERRMCRFFPADVEETKRNTAISAPIVPIKISATNPKFADELSHRDILGSLMHLGINRNKTGDILMLPPRQGKKKTDAIVFVSESIEDFVCTELTRIRHTTVNAEQTDFAELHYTPSFEEINGTVSSIRVDAVFSSLLHISRSNFKKLLEDGYIFINYRTIFTGNYLLEEDDIVSIRGYGKYIFKATMNQTKKGRYHVTVLKYI